MKTVVMEVEARARAGPPERGGWPLNREGWLTLLGERLEQDIFRDFLLPAYRVSCGFPSRNATGMRKRLGECHSPLSSDGGILEIFITPALDSPLRVASVLTHELAHAAAGVWDGHGRRFRNVCQAIGLTVGPPSAMMPGEQLKSRLRAIVAGMPPYPHHRMLVGAK